MSEDPKRIVENGYDAIADRYADWSQNEVEGSPAVEYLRKLIGMLPLNTDVLELGCGNGEPAARMLSEGREYTGADISGEQLRRAKELVPSGAFLKADYTTLEFAPSSFDAVVALYTFGHVPQGELPPLLGRIGSWLRPGGHLLATMNSRDEPEAIYDFLGVPMFFSGFDVDRNLDLVAGVGLELVEHDVVCQDEGDQGKPCFLWLLGRKR
jgi:SAM-dependent methyltransferase